MTVFQLRRITVAGVLAGLPSVALPHSFSTPYVLPIPYWMYVYGCAATLIVTFAVLGIFVSRESSTEQLNQSTRFAAGARVRAVGLRLLFILRAGAIASLLMTLAGSLVDSMNPAADISLTLFWVVFLLGWTYLTAFVGDLYPFVNPWLTTVNGLVRLGMPLSKERLRYPHWLGCWPAFVFYVGLISIELFVVQTQWALLVLLLIYGTVTLLGVATFGKRNWFELADFFSVFFRIVGRMAPVLYLRDRHDGIREIRLRRPLSGLLSEQPQHVSLLLFVLFMLSSTAYDGIHDTQLWTALFWKNMLEWLQPLWGDDLGKAQVMLMDLYLVYRYIGLLAFPFLYLILFAAALLVTKLITRSSLPLRELSLQFTYSLVPVAFGYHFAHYYTYLVVQFRGLPALFVSLFGGGGEPTIQPEEFGDLPTGALKMVVVWHTQVGVVLLGHVVSVVLAHFEATRLFPTRAYMLISQVPLLVLMVVYTMLGLWILSLPLS